MGALDGEAGGGGCALGVGMQRHQRGGEVETVAPPRRGDGSEQNLACSLSAIFILHAHPRLRACGGDNQTNQGTRTWQV
jgi:hypothetical protein